MIGAVDAALERYAREALGDIGADIEVSFEAPTQEWSGALTRPALSIYLYDVREPTDNRASAFHTEKDPNNPSRTRMRRAPLRLRLSYLLSCWAADAGDQHWMLGRLIERLARDPRLTGLTPPLPESAPLELRADASRAEDLHALWAGLGNRIRPALQLAVPLEIALPQEAEGPPVTTRQIALRMGAGGALSLRGTLLDPGGQPARGATVTALRVLEQGAGLRQEGRTVTVDATGAWRLAGLPLGRYRLLVEHPDGQGGVGRRVVEDVVLPPPEASPDRQEFTHDIEPGPESS